MNSLIRFSTSAEVFLNLRVLFYACTERRHYFYACAERRQELVGLTLQEDGQHATCPTSP